MVIRKYSFLLKTSINMALLFVLFFLSGCSDSKKDQKHTQLQLDFNQLKIKNTQLVSNNQNIQKDLSDLRNKNTSLNVSLAKGELFFSQKYKAKFESEMKKGKEEAYKNAETTISGRYKIILISIVCFVIISYVIWFFTWKRSCRLISKNDSSIDDLQNANKSLESEKDELNKKIKIFDHVIEDLKRKAKETSLNQVVDKINTLEAKRNQASFINKGSEHGN